MDRPEPGFVALIAPRPPSEPEGIPPTVRDEEKAAELSGDLLLMLEEVRQLLLIDVLPHLVAEADIVGTITSHELDLDTLRKRRWIQWRRRHGHGRPRLQ